MKKLITASAFALLANFAIAQETYTIKSALKIDGLPPEYAAFGEQDITTMIKGEKTKTEMTGMMGSNVIVFDGAKMTSISEQMGNKTGFTATKAELDADKKDEKTPANKPKIEYFTDKKTIAGYECTKAVITSIGKDKKETKATAWVTDKIKMPDDKAKKGMRGGGGMMDLGDLKGYPLSIESSMNQGGMEMKMMLTATEVSTAAIDDKTFTVDTEGYKMSSYKEYQEKMKAAAGQK